MAGAVDNERLRELRDTAWTEAGYLYWQRGDPNKREVWTMHVDTHLDDQLRALIEGWGQPEAIAIRRHGDAPNQL